VLHHWLHYPPALRTPALFFLRPPPSSLSILVYTSTRLAAPTSSLSHCRLFGHRIFRPRVRATCLRHLLLPSSTFPLVSLPGRRLLVYSVSSTACRLQRPLWTLFTPPTSSTLPLSSTPPPSSSLTRCHLPCAIYVYRGDGGLVGIPGNSTLSGVENRLHVLFTLQRGSTLRHSLPAIGKFGSSRMCPLLLTYHKKSGRVDR